jgi:hypothetical protein
MTETAKPLPSEPSKATQYEAVAMAAQRAAGSMADIRAALAVNLDDYGKGAETKGAADGLSQAARDVLAERQRQISAEGWTTGHDDEHATGGLALAAACYAISGRGVNQWPMEAMLYDWWPWDRKWWKPKTRRRDLVKAAALILAEIERIDRVGGDADSTPNAA